MSLTPPIAVADKVRQTSNKYNHIIRFFASKPASDTLGISSDSVIDTQDRFKLWVGNIGAAHNPESKLSLESRLTDAPELLEEVSELLDELIEALQDLSEIIDGSRENRTIPTTSYVNEDNEFDDQDSDVGTKSEAFDILEVATDSIRNLLRISILIGKATPRDRFSKAFNDQRDGFLDQFDINYVAERYPKLSRPDFRWLCERLGRANTKRRQFLRYCREHRDRLAEGTEGRKAPNNVVSLPVTRDTKLDKNANTGDQTMAKQPVATFLQQPSSMANTRQSTHASTLDVSLLQPANENLDDEVQSSTTFTSLADVEGEAILNLPSLADVSHGMASFECPLCRNIKSFKHEKAWKQHAYRDLRAYTCTLGKHECDFEYFGDSKSWFKHEMTHHRCEWMCIVCDEGPFMTRKGFVAHVESYHTEMKPDQISTIANAGQHPLKAIPARDCPFCDEWVDTLKVTIQEQTQLHDCAKDGLEEVLVVEPQTFRRHVTFHLQQLALFSLPRLSENEPENTSSSHATQRIRVELGEGKEELSLTACLRECFHKAEMFHATGSILIHIRDSLPERVYSQELYAAIDTLLKEVSSCSFLLHHLADHALIYCRRVLLDDWLFYHLNTILPCLSRTLQEMELFLPEDLATDIGWVMIRDVMIHNIPVTNPISRFLMYHEYLDILLCSLLRVSQFDMRALEKIRDNILLLRVSLYLPPPSVMPPVSIDATLFHQVASHWATKIFSSPPLAETKINVLSVPHCESFGPVIELDDLRILSDAQVFFCRPLMNGSRSLVAFVHDDGECHLLLRSSVLRSSEGTSTKVSIQGCQELSICRSTADIITLSRWDEIGQCVLPWLTLRYNTLEELVLFHCTFLSLKYRYSSSQATSFRELWIEKERTLFSAKIVDDGFPHKLYIKQDIGTGHQRLHVVALDDSLQEVPVWTAFPPFGPSGEGSFVLRKSRHKVWIREVRPYVFCPEYNPQNQISGRAEAFEVFFIHTNDASRFKAIFSGEVETETSETETSESEISESGDSDSDGGSNVATNGDDDSDVLEANDSDDGTPDDILAA